MDDVALVAKLQIRRAAAWFSRAFSIAVSSLVRDTSGMDRAYQIYAALVVLVAFGLLWVMALAQVEEVFSSMPALAAEGFLRLAFAMAICAAYVLGIKAVRVGPFRYSPADISLLIASPVSLGVVFLSGFVASVGKAFVIGVAAGSALGIACFSAGLIVEPACLLVPIPLMCGFLAGFPWVIGSLRVRSGSGRSCTEGRSALLLDSALAKWCLRAGLLLAGAAALVAVMRMGQDALLGLASSASCGPCLLLIAAEAASVFLLGRNADASAIAQESEVSCGTKKDAMTAMLAAASFGADAMKDEARRRRVIRRKPVLRLSKNEGIAAVFARSALSVARQREGWGLLAMAGGVIAPFGAIALSSSPNPVLLIGWMLLLQCSSRTVKEISRSFRDDTRLRAMRDRLPFSTLSLFVFDAAPGFIISLSAQLLLLLALMLFLPFESAALPALQQGIGLPELMLLSPLILLGMAICCVFDAVRAPFGIRGEIGYELAAFLFSAIPSMLAFLGASYGFVLASVAMTCLMLVALSARWGD